MSRLPLGRMLQKHLNLYHAFFIEASKRSFSFENLILYYYYYLFTYVRARKNLDQFKFKFFTLAARFLKKTNVRSVRG